MKLTKKQKDICIVLKNVTKKVELSLTLQELADWFGTSKENMQKHIDALKRKGAVVNIKNKPRSFRVVEGII